MQSPLSLGPVEPFQLKTDVQHLEKLLNRIFGDELEKSLAGGDNLIEFPQSPFKEQTEQEEHPVSENPSPIEIAQRSSNLINEPGSLLDFSPEIFSGQSLKSIIEEDVADSKLSIMIEAQRKELEALRLTIKDRDHDIKLYKLELAACNDQLKYLPELFNKALSLSDTKQALKEMEAAYETEKAQREQCLDLLEKSQNRIERIKNSAWYKLAQFFGYQG